jgi:hypothetical protein
LNCAWEIAAEKRILTATANREFLRLIVPPVRNAFQNVFFPLGVPGNPEVPNNPDVGLVGWNPAFGLLG